MGKVSLNPDRLKKWSSKVKERDNCICQFCGASHRKVISHHIIPVKVSRRFWYNVDNGLTLCTTCHAEWHKIDPDYWIILDIMRLLKI